TRRMPNGTYGGVRGARDYPLLDIFFFVFHKHFIFGFYNSLTNMEVTNESNPKILGLCQQKATEKFYFISDFIGLIGRNFSLFDSDEVQQNSRKQSL
ncbi:hypothetical protein, partial [Streptococcus pneumoniae]|uniref:hypothetical protein n=1 Tax=Streptococcus pneumoniae TaxID=1313 RepID=UPI001CD25D08